MVTVELLSFKTGEAALTATVSPSNFIESSVYEDAQKRIEAQRLIETYERNSIGVVAFVKNELARFLSPDVDIDFITQKAERLWSEFKAKKLVVGDKQFAFGVVPRPSTESIKDLVSFWGFDPIDLKDKDYLAGVFFHLLPPFFACTYQPDQGNGKATGEMVCAAVMPDQLKYVAPGESKNNYLRYLRERLIESYRYARDRGFRAYGLGGPIGSYTNMGEIFRRADADDRKLGKEVNPIVIITGHDMTVLGMFETLRESVRRVVEIDRLDDEKLQKIIKGKTLAVAGVGAIGTAFTEYMLSMGIYPSKLVLTDIIPGRAGDFKKRLEASHPGIKIEDISELGGGDIAVDCSDIVVTAVNMETPFITDSAEGKIIIDDGQPPNAIEGIKGVLCWVTVNLKGQPEVEGLARGYDLRTLNALFGCEQQAALAAYLDNQGVDIFNLSFCQPGKTDIERVFELKNTCEQFSIGIEPGILQNYGKAISDSVFQKVRDKWSSN